MSKFTIKIQGLDQLKGKFRQLPKTLKTAGVQELNMIAEEIMLDSKENYVPWRFGHLKSSGTVLHAKGLASKNVVKLVYGGRSAPYAVYVHEIKKKYKHGRKWKYLETPVKNRAPSIGREVGQAIVKAAQTQGL